MALVSLRRRFQLTNTLTITSTTLLEGQYQVELPKRPEHAPIGESSQAVEEV